MVDEIHTLETDMFEKVDELLADTGKISIQTSLRLSLQLQRTTAEAMNSIVNHIKIQNGRIAKLETQTKELSEKNIINWILQNPKLSVLYFVLFVLFIDVMVDSLTSANVIGILVSAGKKLIGL